MNNNIDLNKCKPGQKLKSKHGMILTYVRKDDDLIFPHLVQYPNGAMGARTDDGQVSAKKKLPEDHDIVEILD
jgi:hypothetical protein